MSYLINFGLFVDLPVHTPNRDVLHERVLFSGVPNNFTDPTATFTYSIWHTMLASMANLRHSMAVVCHVISTDLQWRPGTAPPCHHYICLACNMVTDMHTLLGAALNSNHFSSPK